MYMGDTWEQEWKKQTSTDGRPNLITSNTGIVLKTAAYNVAEYNMKPATGSGTDFIWNKPEKLQNLRRWIAENDFDIMMTTEDATYLDANSTKKASMLIYYDRLPSSHGGWVRIRSKYPIIKPKKQDGTILNLVAVEPPNNATTKADGKKPATRYFTFGWIKLNGKTILVISVHPMNSFIKYTSNPKVGPVSERKTFMQIVFDLVYCLRHTQIFDGIVSCKAWDYCIIGGDFNTSNRNGVDKNGKAYTAGTTDWDNLIALRNYYGFDSASGGYLGWLPTYPSNKECLDNILVSGNIILGSIKNDVEEYSKLHSDHAPLKATMTLLDEVDKVRFPSKTYEGKSDTKQLRTWLTELMTGKINHPCT